MDKQENGLEGTPNGHGDQGEPGGGQTPPQGKSRIGFYLLGGCGLLAVLAIVAMLVVIFFTKKKVSTLVANPAMTAAETAVKLSPELELVSSDHKKNKITIKNKATGETITIDVGEARDGLFDFADKMREVFKPNAEGAKEDGAASSDGTTREVEAAPEPVAENPADAPNAADAAAISVDEGMIPEWVVVYPKAPAKGLSNLMMGGTESGIVEQNTGDDNMEVLHRLEDLLVSAGYRVSATNITAQSWLLSATHTDGKRTIVVTAGVEGGRTNLQIRYNKTV